MQSSWVSGSAQVRATGQTTSWRGRATIFNTDFGLGSPITHNCGHRVALQESRQACSYAYC
eukprot:3985853-Amphidinium_carterae.1